MHTCLHHPVCPCVVSAPVPHEGAWRHVGWFIGLICSMIITPDIPQRSRAATYQCGVTLLQKHTHTHTYTQKHYITIVSHCWMRLAIAWSLYTHPHTQTHHYATATDGMSHLGHAAPRWDVVEYFTDDALVSERGRSHEPHCVQAGRVWPMFFHPFYKCDVRWVILD